MIATVWVAFFSGCFIGGFAGVAIMALLVASRCGDE